MRRAGQPDIRLLQAVAVVGKKKLNKWSTVAEMVGSRSQTQCRERYCNILDPDLKAGKRYLQEWYNTKHDYCPKLCLSRGK